MTGERVWLRGCGIGALAFERGGDPPVEVPSLLPQEGAVGDILAERVLEGIDGVGARAVAEKEAGAHEAVQRSREIGFVKPGDLADQGVRELAADGGASLNDIARHAESVEPRE